MAVTRARWFCPTAKVMKARDFTDAAKLAAFKAQPRDFLVYYTRENDTAGRSRPYVRRNYG